jgi:hypothetical protein
VKVFPYNGPGIASRELDSFQDNFPEADAINMLTPGAMHVRLDMANNISLATALRNDPGDSMVLDVVAVRSGAALAGNPVMHYTIQPATPGASDPFLAFRTTPLTGSFAGWPAVGLAGPVPDKFAFDLPDSGTLFPGDVMHYYIEATDEVNLLNPQTSTLPANTAGYGDFSNPEAYNTSYVVHALPTIVPAGFGLFKQPSVLFWNDFANRGGENEWYGSLNNLGMVAGTDYDIYYTNGPSSGVGNGIGGRTTGLALGDYSTLLYTSGNLGVNTISNGDFNNDAGDDVSALTNWLAAGNKNLFMTGDDLVSDMALNGGAATLTFTESVMGVNLVPQGDNLRPFITNQATPLVLAINPNPVWPGTCSWIAYGGCFSINTFDAVTTRVGAVRLAEFADKNGDPGAYSFSAATLFTSGTNTCISLPYDFMYVYDSPAGCLKINAPLSTRAQMLEDVLNYFGETPSGSVSATDLPEKQFAVQNYPNPFNPSTKISYTIKRPGNLMMKVFNVRGELVKTLIDGHVESSNFVMWDGTNNQGSNVSSGVYFVETRSNGEVRVNKMALMK